MNYLYIVIEFLLIKSFNNILKYLFYIVILFFYIIKKVIKMIKFRSLLKLYRDKDFPL